MAKPDPNRVLARLPIVVGGLAGILLLINRLLTPQLTNSQARADALGVILSAMLILTVCYGNKYSRDHLTLST